MMIKPTTALKRAAKRWHPARERITAEALESAELALATHAALVAAFQGAFTEIVEASPHLARAEIVELLAESAAAWVEDYDRVTSPLLGEAASLIRPPSG
jgi:hypothetical protein